MPLILAALAVTGIIIFVNWLDVLKNDRFSQMFDWLLLAVNLLLLLIGLQYLLLPPDFLVRFR